MTMLGVRNISWLTPLLGFAPRAGVGPEVDVAGRCGSGGSDPKSNSCTDKKTKTIKLIASEWGHENKPMNVADSLIEMCFKCRRSSSIIQQADMRACTRSCRRWRVGVLSIEEVALRAFSISWSSWSSFIRSKTIESRRACSHWTKTRKTCFLFMGHLWKVWLRNQLLNH